MAVVRHKEKTLVSVGNADTSVSSHLKAWIQGTGADGSPTLVCGVIGEGSTLELQSNWDSPFEQDNPGSFFEKVGGIVQVAFGVTSKTTLNSAQVWNGNRPITITLTLLLYALSNPRTEVEAAITALKEFASPEVNANLPVTISKTDGKAGVSGVMGRIPGTVSLSVGRNFIYPEMIIESISEPLDTVRDKQGNRIRAAISLTMQTDVMISKSKMAGLSA